jgi:predicted TIM-barrel fold metal-dependent hydrolase
VTLNDVHCHFFSPGFFQALAAQKKIEGDDPVGQLTALLGWEHPRSNGDLAGRWVGELDRHQVGRAALIASLPGDEDSVAEAVSRYPQRFVGFFMIDPTAPGAVERARRALAAKTLRCLCLFPAMHHYPVYDERALALFETAAREGGAVFVHCGVLSVGVRKKLGLPSRFDMRFGNPLDLHSVALRFPDLPILVPHFGAGLFREALMVADLCPNIYLDTSSSNSWLRYHPGLTLGQAFSQALTVVGPERLLFGTDSSFFPRGWQAPVWQTQVSTLDALGVGSADQAKIFKENFDRLFPV